MILEFFVSQAYSNYIWDVIATNLSDPLFRCGHKRPERGDSTNLIHVALTSSNLNPAQSFRDPCAYVVFSGPGRWLATKTQSICTKLDAVDFLNKPCGFLNWGGVWYLIWASLQWGFYFLAFTLGSLMPLLASQYHSVVVGIVFLTSSQSCLCVSICFFVNCWWRCSLLHDWSINSGVLRQKHFHDDRKLYESEPLGVNKSRTIISSLLALKP